MNIELHLESLLLDGVDLRPGQRDLVRQAVEAELSRLLTERGLANVPAGDSRVANLGAAPVQLAPGDDPVRLGRQIAQSVYGSIGSLAADPASERPAASAD